MNGSQPKRRLWGLRFFTAQANTEHLFATRVWRPQADDEIAHTAIIIVIITLVVSPLDAWSNIGFSVYGFSTPFSCRMHCQMTLIGSRFWKWMVPKTINFGSSFFRRHEHTQSTCWQHASDDLGLTTKVPTQQILLCFCCVPQMYY